MNIWMFNHKLLETNGLKIYIVKSTEMKSISVWKYIGLLILSLYSNIYK